MKKILPYKEAPAAVVVFRLNAMCGIPMGISFYCKTIINNREWFEQDEIDYAQKIDAIPPLSSKDLPDYIAGQ